MVDLLRPDAYPDAHGHVWARVVPEYARRGGQKSDDAAQWRQVVEADQHFCLSLAHVDTLNAHRLNLDRNKQKCAKKRQAPI
jgi:hypothetical protein